MAECVANRMAQIRVAAPAPTFINDL